MPADVVRLEVAGRQFEGFTGITISMGIETMADAFSLTMPYDDARADLRAALQPYTYPECKVYLDEDLLLTGRVEKLAPGVNEGERTVSVEGRSRTGVLTDCAIEGDLEFSGLTLAQIARKLCAPFGVSVLADTDTPAIAVARAEYGQTVDAFLHSLAAPRNIFLNSTFKGQLRITSASALSQAAEVATLREGEKPLMEIGASFDGTRRFSSYGVSAQSDGEVDISGSESDSGIPVHRPTLIQAKDTDPDPKATARRARMEAIAASLQISATVSGWRTPAGSRWHERQSVVVGAPGVMLVTERKYLIAEVTYKLDAGSGKTVALKLAMAEAYAGQTLGVLPWV